jgi:beta-barrel assembly-enhancing protease
VKKIKISLAVFLSIIVFACSSGINIFSDADDAGLGAQFAEEISKNQAEYPVYNNPGVKTYINDHIFKEILQTPVVKKKGIYNYHFEIINNDSILNAFAVPGGYLYLYTGLIKYLDSEAALAGVIAHEIGHVEKRHSTRRITASYGISILMGAALGENPNQMVEIAANLFTGLALLANSRSDEDESDEFAVNALLDTRFYPGGVKFFFEKMKNDKLIEDHKNELATFLSTHPDPIERIETANARVKSLGLPVKHYTDSGKGIFREEYKKNILDLM